MDNDFYISSMFLYCKKKDKVQELKRLFDSARTAKVVLILREKDKSLLTVCYFFDIKAGSKEAIDHFHNLLNF